MQVVDEDTRSVWREDGEVAHIDVSRVNQGRRFFNRAYNDDNEQQSSVLDTMTGDELVFTTRFLPE